MEENRENPAGTKGIDFFHAINIIRVLIIMKRSPEEFHHLELREVAQSRESIHQLVGQISFATELAAIAAARTRGKGDKILSDQLAVGTLLKYLNGMNFSGRVVIGEGEKDKAPQIKTGEMLGEGNGPEVDIAIDPLEGTNLTAKSLFGAMSVLALSERDGLLGASDDIVYMDKLVVGPAAVGKVSIEAPVEKNLSVIASSLDRDIRDLMIVVLDRERNLDLIDQIRKTDANAMVISDGDLLPGIAACMSGSGVHAVMGIGGSAEGVITAAAVKCLGGEMQIKWWPKNQDEIRKLTEANLDPEKVYHHDDLASGKWIIFSATAVTDTYLGLEGVHFFGGGMRTHSLVISMIDGYTTRDYIDRTHKIDSSGEFRI